MVTGGHCVFCSVMFATVNGGVRSVGDDNGVEKSNVTLRVKESRNVPGGVDGGSVRSDSVVVSVLSDGDDVLSVV